MQRIMVVVCYLVTLNNRSLINRNCMLSALIVPLHLGPKCVFEIDNLMVDYYNPFAF
jgi:hypothetical protein